MANPYPDADSLEAARADLYTRVLQEADSADFTVPRIDAVRDAATRLCSSEWQWKVEFTPDGDVNFNITGYTPKPDTSA